MGALLAVWAFAMRYELFLNGIIWIGDIPRQAYGLRAYNADTLRAGQFPLWTSSLWSGFPIFADSFAEPLYPLNLLLLPIGSPLVALVALYALSVLIAGLGMYLLARTLGLGPLAAFAGGMAYMLSGFMITQVLHLNMLGCAIWLPLMCWALERALQTGSWRYVALGCVLVCVQLFGGHVQTGLMSLMGLVVYAVLRVAVPPAAIAARHGAGVSGLARRALQAALMTVVMCTLGFVLSAVQMVPFAELFLYASGRTGTLWTYAIAGQGSLAPFQLVNLVIPYFFRLPPSGGVAELYGWGYLLQNQTYPYLGAPALLLGAAALALPHERRRLAWVTAAGAVLFLLVALGTNTPLYRLIYNTPILHNTRIPGRYLYLFALYTALLAALGVQALRDAAGHARAGRIFAWGAALGEAALIGLALLGAWFVRTYPAATLDFLNGPAQLSPERNADPFATYGHLVDATTLDHFHFYFPLLLCALSAAWAIAWYRARGSRPTQLALAGLLAVAALYGADYLPRIPMAEADAQVRATNGAVADRLPPGSLERVYSAGYGLNAPLDPNLGLAMRLPEATGYTLVDPARLHELSDRANADVCNAKLLSLWGVRYFWRHAAWDSSLLGAIAYSTQLPVFAGRLPDAAKFAFAVPAGTRSARIVLLSGFTDGSAPPPPAPVAEVLVEDASGGTQRFALRAGVEVGAPAAAALAFDGDPPRAIYSTAFELSGEVEIRHVELRLLAPNLGWTVYGLTLAGADGSVRFRAQPFLGGNCQGATVYSSGPFYLLENPTPGPREFLVNQVIAAHDPSDIIRTMRARKTDLTRVAVVEGLDAQAVSGNGDAGTARIAAYSDMHVAIDVDARTPALLVLTDWAYPGWKATVDGQPARIYTTDYVFRGVPVPAGAHRVEFSYDPLSFRVGITLSVFALFLTLGLLWRGRLSLRVLGLCVLGGILTAATVISWPDVVQTWDESAALATQVTHELQAELPEPAAGTRFYFLNLPFVPGPSWALAQPWLSDLVLEPVFPGRGVSGADIQMLGDYREVVRPPWDATPGMIAYRYSDGGFALTPYYFGQHSSYRLADLLPVGPATQAPQAVLGDWLELQGSAIITQALNIDDGRIGGRFLQTSWLLRRSVAAPYALFVHFTGADGQIVAQADHTLSVWAADRPDGMYINEWPTGVVIRDYVALPDAVAAPTQTLQIRIGVWLPDSGERLPVTSGPLQADEDGRLIIGDLPR